MQKGLPLSPAELCIVSPEVFDATNELLRKTKPNQCGERKILHKHIVFLAGRGLHFDQWPDFEESYQDKGWTVVHTRPGKYDYFDAYFIFTPKG
jgi:hypothetical protein